MDRAWVVIRESANIFIFATFVIYLRRFPCATPSMKLFTIHKRQPSLPTDKYYKFTCQFLITNSLRRFILYLPMTFRVVTLIMTCPSDDQTASSTVFVSSKYFLLERGVKRDCHETIRMHLTLMLDDHS